MYHNFLSLWQPESITAKVAVLSSWSDVSPILPQTSCFLQQVCNSIELMYFESFGWPLCLKKKYFSSGKRKDFKDEVGFASVGLVNPLWKYSARPLPLAFLWNPLRQSDPGFMKLHSVFQLIVSLSRCNFTVLVHSHSSSRQLFSVKKGPLVHWSPSEGPL